MAYLEKMGCSDASKVYVCEHKIAQPTVFIPVFPGKHNCEYDSAKAFERAGAKVITKVFQQSGMRADIRDSVEVFLKKQSVSRRSSCSRADSVQVMSQMDLPNSLQLHSRTQSLKEAVAETFE